MFALRSRVFLVGAVVGVLAASCAKEGRTPVHPVHGQVLFEGRPVPNALVVFHPAGELAGGSTLGKPHAIAGADGFFTLGTYAADDGAPAGDYAVTVELWLAGTPGVSLESDSTPTNRLPARYANPATSRLTARVGEGANELPTFKLAR
jgi:hypothetical protein